VKKGQNGRKSLRRLKPTVRGCNDSKRRRRRYFGGSVGEVYIRLLFQPVFYFFIQLGVTFCLIIGE
jgi:hypothetical protein